MAEEPTKAFKPPADTPTLQGLVDQDAAAQIVYNRVGKTDGQITLEDLARQPGGSLFNMGDPASVARQQKQNYQERPDLSAAMAGAMEDSALVGAAALRGGGLLVGGTIDFADMVTRQMEAIGGLSAFSSFMANFGTDISLSPLISKIESAAGVAPGSGVSGVVRQLIPSRAVTPEGRVLETAIEEAVLGQTAFWRTLGGSSYSKAAATKLFATLNEGRSGLATIALLDAVVGGVGGLALGIAREADGDLGAASELAILLTASLGMDAMLRIGHVGQRQIAKLGYSQSKEEVGQFFAQLREEDPNTWALLQRAAKLDKTFGIKLPTTTVLAEDAPMLTEQAKLLAQGREVAKELRENIRDTNRLVYNFLLKMEEGDIAKIAPELKKYVDEATVTVKAQLAAKQAKVGRTLQDAGLADIQMDPSRIAQRIQNNEFTELAEDFNDLAKAQAADTVARLGPSASDADAIKIIRDATHIAEINYRIAVVQTLYKKVDTNELLDAAPLFNAREDVLGEFFAGRTKKDIPEWMDDIKAMAEDLKFDRKDPSKEIYVPLGRLQTMRSEALHEIRAERGLPAPREAKIHFLNQLVDSMENQVIETSVRPELQAANAAYKKGREIWKQEPLLGVMKRTSMDGPYKMSASRAAQRFFDGNAKGGTNNKAAINNLIEATGGGDTAIEALKSAVVNSFISEGGANLTGTINLPVAQRWWKNHQEALLAFPEIRKYAQDIMRQGGRSADVKRSLTQATTDMKRALQEHGKTLEDISSGAAQTYLGTHPSVVISRTLRKQEPEKEIQRLMQALKGSPEAQAGLRRAVWQELIEMTTGRNNGPIEDIVLDTAGFDSIMTDFRPILEELYTEKHMEFLEAARDVVSIMAGGKAKRVSRTATAGEFDYTLSMYLSRAYGLARDVIGLPYVATELALRKINTAISKMHRDELHDIFQQAMFDPRFADDIANMHVKGKNADEAWHFFRNSIAKKGYLFRSAGVAQPKERREQ